MSLGTHIALLLVVAAGSLVAIGISLWWFLGQPSVQVHGSWTAAESFDFAKIVLSIVGGIGGVVALVVAYRKQRLGEAAEQREDAKLFAENFTKATEQLGSENAPVRLAGMYALERLAQTTPEQRQTIVNVFCAYLRMPFTMSESGCSEEGTTAKASSDTWPEDRGTAGDFGTTTVATAPLHGSQQDLQERQVRLTAQRILAAHLEPGDDPKRPTESFWPDIDLDLTGATLLDFDLSHTRPHAALFDGTQFVGLTGFAFAEFCDGATFRGALFAGVSSFEGVRFGKSAWFHEANFAQHAWFTETQLVNARFDGAQFAGDARFEQARFEGSARFHKTCFGGRGRFEKARFAGTASFLEAQFAMEAAFDWAQFDGEAVFQVGKFSEETSFEGVQFSQDVRFENAEFAGDSLFEATRFYGEARFDKAQFAANTGLMKAQFAKTAHFQNTQFAKDEDVPQWIRRSGLPVTADDGDRAHPLN
jgi:uncharacterized protein YjbI with pentapeptide repeats